MRTSSPECAPGLVAVIRNPDARTLALLYRKDVEYVLLPRFLIDQLVNVNRVPEGAARQPSE